MKRPGFDSFTQLVFVLFAIAAVILLAVQNHKLSALLDHQRVPQPGEKAAVLRGQDIYGNTVDMARQDVVLIFFSTTCQSCIDSAHAWREFYERHRDGTIRVLGVSTEGKDRTRDFVNRFGLAFPVVADPAGRILLGYRVKYLPTVAAVSKKGRFVFYQAHGQDATAALDAAVRALASSF